MSPLISEVWILHFHTEGWRASLQLQPERCTFLPGTRGLGAFALKMLLAAGMRGSGYLSDSLFRGKPPNSPSPTQAWLLAGLKLLPAEAKAPRDSSRGGPSRCAFSWHTVSSGLQTVAGIGAERRRPGTKAALPPKSGVPGKNEELPLAEVPDREATAALLHASRRHPAVTAGSSQRCQQ